MPPKQRKRSSPESIVATPMFAAHGFLSARRDWATTPALRSRVLAALADALDRRRDEIIATTSDETALMPSELQPEFDRMTGTLRMFAELVSTDAWRRPAIDTAPRGRSRTIGPGHDCRSLLMPLGAVAVFGASNFPLAYGVLGGDTASALAAGCSVVVKEHPAHPRTGRLLLRIAHETIEERDISPRLLGYVLNPSAHDLSPARSVVLHPHISAVGFTGSIPGGLAIEQLARSRRCPIPVFAEMGSVNPVRITPRALAARGPEIARTLAASILLRAGQQCTKPGIIYVPGNAKGAQRFVAELARCIAAAPARDLLSPSIRDSFNKRVRTLSKARGVKTLARGGAARGPRSASPHLFHVHVHSVRESAVQEIFGPAAVIIQTTAWDGLNTPALHNLTGTIFFEPADLRAIGDSLGAFDMPFISHIEGRRAGRVIFNGVPTGVRVCESMVHSGPFPACNRPDTTAVGPRAIERWCRPVCWQNAPDALLPDALKDANPQGVIRMVNGKPTRQTVKR